MRVLQVIPSVAPRYGGPSRVVLGMCSALERRGVDALIATTDADGPGRLAVESGRLIRYAGVPTVFFPRQWSEAFKYSRPLERWLGKNVGGFDVVHVHAVFSHACLAAAAACRRHGVPYVVRPLGTLDPWSLRQKRLQKRLLWYFGAARMLRHASAIHYTAADERRLAEQALHLGRGVVVPNGVDAALLDEAELTDELRRRYASLSDAPYALVLCRLHAKKGLELLIAAFLETTARAELRHWRLVVAGDGDPGYVGRLKELVARRAAGDRIVFTGWLDGELKRSALRGAALMVLPSRQENFGLSLVESLACGVPVLVSPHVNLAEHVARTGAGWIAPLDPAGFGRILAEALADDTARRRRGAAGRALVREQFTWPAVAAQLVELYRTLASGPLTRARA